MDNQSLIGFEDAALVQQWMLTIAFLGLAVFCLLRLKSAYAVLGFVVAAWWHRRKRVPVAAQAPSWAPSRITPLGVVTGLRRLEQGLPADKAKALRDEIVLLELKYFGPNAGASSEQELRAVVEKWQKS